MFEALMVLLEPYLKMPSSKFTELKEKRGIIDGYEEIFLFIFVFSAPIQKRYVVLLART